MGFTGKWSGFYIYLGDYHTGYFGERVDFIMEINEIEGEIKGTCNEIKNEYSVDGESTIAGIVNGEIISFELVHPSLMYVDEKGKTIEDKNHKMTVLYQGEYDEETDVFCGSWHIDEKYEIGEEEELIMAGDGIWKMKRVPEIKSDFDVIYEFLENRFTQIRAIKNTALFKIDDHYIHVNGNGSANSISKIEQDADCTIIISSNTFMDMIHANTPFNFMMNNAVKTKGDFGTTIKIQTLLA